MTKYAIQLKYINDYYTYCDGIEEVPDDFKTDWRYYLKLFDSRDEAVRIAKEENGSALAYLYRSIEDMEGIQDEILSGGLC